MKSLIKTVNYIGGLAWISPRIDSSVPDCFIEFTGCLNENARCSNRIPRTRV